MHLTWKQWRLLEPSLYVTATRPGSADDRALTQALGPVKASGLMEGPQISYAGPLSSLHFSARLSTGAAAARLRGHVVMGSAPTISCGSKPTAMACAPMVMCCPISIGSCGFGPSSGLKANPATQEASGGFSSDLDVFNPNGPSVSFAPSYRSLRGTTDLDYQFDDFGPGWTQPYNMDVSGPTGSDGNPVHAALPAEPGHTPRGGAVCPVISPGGTGPTTSAGPKALVLPDGSRISFNVGMVPTAAAPHADCTVQAGAPYLAEIDYNASNPTYPYYYVVTTKDRTRLVFALHSNQSRTERLTQIVDRCGNPINLHYTTPGTSALSVNPLMSGLPELTSITDAANNTLLTINRNSYGDVTSVADCYGRSVYYHESNYVVNAGYGAGITTSFAQLDHISQVVPTGTSGPPDRYSFSYEDLDNGEGAGETFPFLHTVTVPSADGWLPLTPYLAAGATGARTATIDYDAATNLVTKITDSNGNKVLFASSYGSNFTTVTRLDAGNNTAFKQVVGYNSDMSETNVTDGLTDGATSPNPTGHTVMTKTFASGSDPYRPSRVTDGNGNYTDYTWDGVGNPLTVAHSSNSTRAPAGATYTWNFPTVGSPNVFALGELASVQMGSKTSTQYAYDDADGYTDALGGFHPCGLVTAIASPTPGTTGGTTRVTTAYIYDVSGHGSQALGRWAWAMC